MSSAARRARRGPGASDGRIAGACPGADRDLGRRGARRRARRSRRHANHRQQTEGGLAGALRPIRHGGDGVLRRPAARREPRGQGRRSDLPALAHQRRHRAGGPAGAQDLCRGGHLFGRHERIRPELHLHAAGPGAGCFSDADEAVDFIEINLADPDRAPAIKPALVAAVGPGAVGNGLDRTEPRLFQRPAGRAQRHALDPALHRGARGDEHHLRPDHAGEEQEPRHRHPAHHGGRQGVDPARLLHGRRGDRPRRHRSPASPSASSSAPTSRRSRPSSSG